MSKKQENLSHEEVWDDSALINSWNEALQEYKKYHSIHAKGGSVRDLEPQNKAKIETEPESEQPQVSETAESVLTSEKAEENKVRTLVLVTCFTRISSLRHGTKPRSLHRRNLKVSLPFRYRLSLVLYKTKASRNSSCLGIMLATTQGCMKVNNKLNRSTRLKRRNNGISILPLKHGRAVAINQRGCERHEFGHGFSVGQLPLMRRHKIEIAIFSGVRA
ncbi:unnamed protein product [Fusarium venenatum]|uniref:Survival Motor Neuron Gemin2-binding domain-containing protein n=1 Tax=Fusarium venenatum TaxID=56646 RepID=A0A2L2TCD6_9HYPO|nr:uncharacterized protein FVRRES_07487 [Fusarium venenatum]CEI63051.1 unnamed protein product [Fusarium venenatum]